MALTLKATTGNASKSLGLLKYPVTRGLLGLYYFGTAETDQLTNHVPGGAALVAVGSPTVNANSVTTNRLIGYDTGIVEPEEYTLVAVAKRPPVAAGRVGLMVGVCQPPAGGTVRGSYIDLDVNTGSLLRNRVKANGSNEYPAWIDTTAAIPVGDVAFYAGTANKVSHAGRCWYGHGGTLVEGTPSAFAYNRETELGYGYTVRVGAADIPFAAGFTNIDVYMAAVHNVPLTDAEMAQVHAFLKTKYADEYGIATL